MADEKYEVTLEELGKKSLVALANEHRANCCNPNCPVHLLLICTWLRTNYRIKFTKEEVKAFI